MEFLENFLIIFNWWILMLIILLFLDVWMLDECYVIILLFI